MLINDRVYGDIKIESSLIQDLIKSSPMQRLRKIRQTGPTYLLEPQREITRYEHSIGVWYLLFKYGASLEEQVAGLLHDTPHTAFSHVADVVFPNKNHTFHEQFEEEVILSSEIPKILEKHGMRLEHVLDKKNFHLLEVDLPDLSADRIDYFLRDTRIPGFFPDVLVDIFLTHLKVENSRFYFDDANIALLYANLFMDTGKFYWLDGASHGSYQLMGNILKHALKENIISREDFFKTDEDILNILRKSQDKYIKKELKNLAPSTKFETVGKNEADFWGPNKPRCVDPWIKVGKKLVRTSDVFPTLKTVFKDFIEAHKYIGVKRVS